VSLSCRASTFPPRSCRRDLRAALVDAIGEEYVVEDDEYRVIHAFGRGVRDLVRVRRGQFGRLPDAVVYPGNEDDVVAVVNAAVAHDAVVIPYGGGSNIVGALEAVPTETRQVLSIDMGRMNKVVEIDEASGLARIEAGVLGPGHGGPAQCQGLDDGALPRLVRVVDTRRLDRDSLDGHAVRQVRRHRRHHPRPAHGDGRAGARTAAAAVILVGSVLYARWCSAPRAGSASSRRRG